MEKDRSSEESKPKKIQVMIGEEIAYVEIISLKNYICSVEILGHEPIFITRIKDKNNNHCWISIPQGNDEMAETLGQYIEESVRFQL